MSSQQFTEVLKYSTLVGKDFNSDALVECFIELIENKNIDRSYGWELRMICNYIFIIGIKCIENNLCEKKIILLNLVKNEVKDLKEYGINLNIHKFIECYTYMDFQSLNDNQFLPSDVEYKEAFKIYTTTRYDSKLAPIADYVNVYGRINHKNMFLCDKNISHYMEDIDVIVERIITLAHNGLLNQEHRELISKLDLSPNHIKDLISVGQYKLDKCLEGLKIDCLTKTILTISEFGDYKRAYYLGFPIQYGLPGINFIKDAIKKLSELGDEEYIKYVLSKYHYTIKNKYEMLNGTDDTNLLALEFDSYLPFDRIEYVDENHVYEFTRESWQSLLTEPMRNPYNRKDLTFMFCNDIENRTILSNTSGIPNAKPMIELYADLNQKRKKVNRSLIDEFKIELISNRIPPYNEPIPDRRMDIIGFSSSEPISEPITQITLDRLMPLSMYSPDFDDDDVPIIEEETSEDEIVSDTPDIILGEDEIHSEEKSPDSSMTLVEDQDVAYAGGFVFDPEEKSHGYSTLINEIYDYPSVFTLNSKQNFNIYIKTLFSSPVVQSLVLPVRSFLCNNTNIMISTSQRNTIYDIKLKVSDLISIRGNKNLWDFMCGFYNHMCLK